MFNQAWSRRRLAVTAVVGTATVLSATAVITVAQAAAGCTVDYRTGSQWPGGFTASVTVTNLGDPIDGWTLRWGYTAGQRVTQGWQAVVTQEADQVTAVNAAWNRQLPTGASATFGLNASWNNASNPAPTAFTLNGTGCTGGVTTTTGPATTRPTAPATTRATTAPTTPPTTRATPTATRPTTPPTTRPTTPPTGPPGTPPASYPNPGVVAGDTGVHDPTVVKTPTGTYLMAHTGDNVSLKTSTDRTTWRNAGAAFPGGASWTTPYTGGARNLWAPDLSYHNGRYYLYYSASSFGSQRSAIFLATSTTGASGSWTHQGLVIESSSSVNYNAIDPNLVVDGQGQWWLSFGSFWSGLKVIRLDPATGRRSTSDTAVRALATRPGNVSGAVEAPTIYRRGGYYYLFASFDFCCRGADSTYRIMVGRSTSVTGPYTDRNGTAMTSGGGTQILAGHGSINGPGHQTVFGDNGQDVLVYHYYTDSGSARLGINLIGWDAAGWPYVY